MTRALRRLLFFICFSTVAALAPPGRARAEVYGEVSFDTSLAPYGEWVVAAHHRRVWRPRGVAAGWRPYFHGRWVWTDGGWFWDSDEPWGWATYHYGRWYVDPVYGWSWVPGYAWAPAWVTWRFGGGAIGWAPLLPGFSVWWTAGYPVSQSAWVFVPQQRFVGAPVERVAFAPARTGAFLSATHFAPPRSASGASAPRLGGPPRQYLERQIGRPIVPARMAAAATPQAARAGRGEGVVSVYRPSHIAAVRPAPHAATTRSAPHRATTGSAPRHEMTRSAPKHATAPSAPRHEATRSAPNHATTQPAPHQATTRSAPRHATTQSAPHHAAAPSAPRQAMARSAPRHEATRPAPSHATAPSAPRAATAPRSVSPAPHAAAPGGEGHAAPAGEGHAAPQRPPPAARPARQAQKSSGHSTT